MTLRMRLRSSGLRSASLRARGRRSRRSVEASRTPLIDSRPGPAGPSASIMPLLINFSLSVSSNKEEEEEIFEDRSIRSEYWISYSSSTSASSIALSLSLAGTCRDDDDERGEN